MPSEPGRLLGRLFGGSPADRELTDQAFLQAMLDTERALAVASARAGVVPEPAAAAIAGVCQAERFDPGDLGRRAEAAGNPVAPLVAGVVDRWFTPAFRRTAPHKVERAVAMLLATSEEGYAGCCEALAAMDLRAGLPAITAPTLVIAGADDLATPPARAEAIVAAIPKARLEVVAGAAHLANIEQPEQVTRLLLEHFIDLSAT